MVGGPPHSLGAVAAQEMTETSLRNKSSEGSSRHLVHQGKAFSPFIKEHTVLISRQVRP